MSVLPYMAAGWDVVVTVAGNVWGMVWWLIVTAGKVLAVLVGVVTGLAAMALFKGKIR